MAIDLSGNKAALLRRLPEHWRLRNTHHWFVKEPHSEPIKKKEFDEPCEFVNAETHAQHSEMVWFECCFQKAKNGDIFHISLLTYS